MDSDDEPKNEMYIPIEPNYYNYEAMEYMEKEIDYYLNNVCINKINICAFEINNDHKYPFLKYLLYKNPQDNVLDIPVVQLDYKLVNSENVIILSQIYLFNVLNLKNYDEYISTLQHKGFYITNNEIYIFYDLTKCNVVINDVYKINKFWFGIMDEILNIGHICNFRISNDTCQFFIENNIFCFLKNKDDMVYELPVVAYTGTHYNMVQYTHTFGVSKSYQNEIMGPYYYFTDYANAIKQGGWSSNGKPEFKYGKLLTESENGKYIKGGIVRFALFMDKIKIIQNHQNDKIDESEIKKKILVDNLDSNRERLTMRITDYDGNWSTNYDSVYVGNIELDDGTKIPNTPIIVLKEYQQQVSLSYHYIDKTFLSDTYQNNVEYHIM